MRKLIDRGDYFEIENYEPIVERDEFGNVLYVINCPYIPKCIFRENEEGTMIKDGTCSSNGADE